MQKHIINSKKAISPILATLLLVVIAVAAIVVAYAWIMTYMSSAGEQAGVMLTKDAVNFQTGTPEHIIIYVRNTGTVDAEISAVYIGTSPSSLTKIDSPTFNPSDGIVKAGGTIEITCEYDWQPLTRYYFRVAPETGAPLEFSEKSP
jgi:flagellin-like protein